MRLGESTFNKKKLALAVASVLAASSSASVFAQGEEELVVTGIRSSFQASQDIKANSKGVVDAISAEDMGKFPDSNVAESLQRITGVSISRRNGEGSQVTVRGFGPDFNMITLNGRVMPSASILSGPETTQNVGGDSSSRAFNMDNIASEGIAGVEVYKTSKANIASGGIGATVNLKTTRPLDNDGLKFSVGAKALRDTTNEEGSDITPELSGLVSWSNDVFGAALSISHQERDSGSSGALVSNWANNFVSDGISANLGARSTADTNVTNVPPEGVVVGEPTDLRLYRTETERERTNGQLTLQYRPMESLTITGDITLAEQTTTSSQTTISQWFQNFPRADVVYDQAVSPTPILLWEESATGEARDTGGAQAYFNEKNELESFGLNVEWQVNDELKLAFDVNDATNTAGADEPFGSQLSFNQAVNGSLAQGVDYSGDIPTLYINYNDGTRANQVANGTDDNVFTADDIGSQILQVANDFSESSVTQIRLDGVFEFSDTGSIDFGLERRELENMTTRAQPTYTLGNWSVENPGDVPNELLAPIDFSDFFDINTSNQQWFSDVSGGTARPFTQGFRVTDIPDASRRLMAIYNPDVNFDDADSLAPSVNRVIEEDITSAYFQLSLESSLGEMPVSILAGLRYESADITASSNVAPLTVRWTSDNDFSPESGAIEDAITVTEDASYDHVLPNLDIALDVTDEVKARFSYGTTIARPRYNAQNVGAVNNSNGPTGPTILPGSQPGAASSGSAGILPLESDNIDFSLEWYFGDASYASIGYFEKRVSNFLGLAPVQRPILGITDPTDGPRAQAALAALQDDDIAVTDENLFSMMASQTSQAVAQGLGFADQSASDWIAWAGTNLGGGFVGNADDNPMIWNVLTPSNENNAKLHGFEIGGQHFFGETGFGLAANYTIVRGNVGYDVTADPSVAQFALLGLSDTANLSLIYENFGFQGRISYNWRDEFLGNIAAPNNGNEPQFTESYSQVDLNLSYEVIDGLFVSFEGINITEEDQRVHGRTERQLNTYTELGARYALGVRYTF